MSSHARLSPSNHRWPNCPGSIEAEAPCSDMAGEAAIDGTGSHLLLEMCLQNNVRAEQYDMQIIGANHEDNINGWLVDAERCKRVQMCLDYVSTRVAELQVEYPDCIVEVESESRSDPGKHFGRTDWSGTCDVTITAFDDDLMFIEVIDYKDGRGWVNVKDNTQLLSYLIGKMLPGRCDCRMTVVQPKTNPVVRYQCSSRYEDGFSAESVIEKASNLNVAANKTDLPNAPRIAGEWCQWCKANPKRGGNCDAGVSQSIEVIESMNEVIGGSMLEQVKLLVGDPTSMSSDQLSEIMSAKDAMMVAFDTCEKEIQARIERGEDVAGYAMLPRNARRTWNTTEEVVVKKLKARRLKLKDIYPQKLISPAQMEKLTDITDDQKKKLTDELVSTVAGKLTLRKVAHKPKLSADDMFATVATLDQPISFL